MSNQLTTKEMALKLIAALYAQGLLNRETYTRILDEMERSPLSPISL